MAKNRNKKLRSITVAGHEYKWLVETVNGDKKLKIWEDKNTVVFHEMIYIDDITPSTVADIIVAGKETTV